MKGMNRIKRGISFKGVSSYVIDRDDPEKEQGQIVGGNMSGTTPAELTEEFRIAQSLRPEIEKPVWHNSLRLPRQEKVTDEKWKQIGDDYMEKMGFSDMHPRVYVKHDDREGQHIHIVASRVALDGEVYLGRNENLKSTKHIQSLEKEHDLTRTKAPEYENGKVVMPEVKELKKGEIEKAVREGEKPSKMKVREYIDDALKEKCTAVEFCERLELVGVKPCPNISKTGKLNGFSFECNGVAFKGSQLGNNYKMAKLQKRGLEYEQTRDCKELTDRKERISRDLKANGELEKRVTGTPRSDSERSVTLDRVRSKSEEKSNGSNKATSRNNARIGGITSSNKPSDVRHVGTGTTSESGEKSPANNMGTTLSSDASRDDRGELIRSWKSRFRKIDPAIADRKRERHILKASREGDKERNRPLQRNTTKKLDRGSNRATLLKSKKSSPKRDLGDDFGLSM